MENESDHKQRWIERTLKLVAKLRPVATCQARAKHAVYLTPDEAAGILTALATTYVVCEGKVSGDEGGDLLAATLDQWVKPPESVS